MVARVVSGAPSEFGNSTAWLAITYLVIHSAFVLCGRRRVARRARILAVNALLMAAFAALILIGLRHETPEARWLLALRLWAPVVFFWWAYTWARHTLYVFHSPDFSYDDSILRWESRRLSQLSLKWARRGSPFRTELLHVFYLSYYLYTPFLGLYLHLEERLLEFEAMTFAVLCGYLVGYTSFALIPVWGPRWALVEAGLLDRAEQRLQGGPVTALINSVMYEGPALKGGAMPSTHSSTGLIFGYWGWQLWGFEAGVIAGGLVLGMWVASIYGRYHYVSDIAVGALLGALALWASTWI